MLAQTLVEVLQETAAQINGLFPAVSGESSSFP